jgi:hypothetical protein
VTTLAFAVSGNLRVRSATLLAVVAYRHHRYENSPDDRGCQHRSCILSLLLIGCGHGFRFRESITNLLRRVTNLRAENPDIRRRQSESLRVPDEALQVCNGDAVSFSEVFLLAPFIRGSGVGIAIAWTPIRSVATTCRETRRCVAQISACVKRNFAGGQIVYAGFDPDLGCFHGVANNGRGCAQQVGLKRGVV